ncbi:MAG: hypothetical protein DYG90_00730 [Chloroflexi bacterium CFX6]|nr:hypothetical protein [Chloroflexi bacterium CFX6]
MSMLIRFIRRTHFALAIWRGWPNPNRAAYRRFAPWFAAGVGDAPPPAEYDPAGDLNLRAAWAVAGWVTR